MRPTKRVATADQDANSAATKKPKLAGVVAIPVATGKEQGKRDLIVLSKDVRKALDVEEAAIAAEAMATPVAVAAEAMVTNVHMMAEAAGLATASSVKQSSNEKTPVTTAAKITNMILAEPGGDNEAPLLEEEKFTNRFRVNDLYSWDRERSWENAVVGVIGCMPFLKGGYQRASSQRMDYWNLSFRTLLNCTRGFASMIF
jgi:hypothetical protein